MELSLRIEAKRIAIYSLRGFPLRSNSFLVCLALGETAISTHRFLILTSLKPYQD